DVALSDAHETPTASAAEIAADRARLALLVADLGELTERQRGALVMRELSGLSHEEIAQAFGISTGSAKQTILEARQSLAEFAQGRAMACEDVCRAISDGNRRTLRGRKVRAHLRDCASCAAFAAAIPARSHDLRAIAPPLSAVAATSLLRRALASGTGHGSGGSTAGSAAGAAGKAAGLTVSAKAVATVAVVASTAAGVTGVVRHLERHSQPSAPPTAPAKAVHHGSTSVAAGTAGTAALSMAHRSDVAAGSAAAAGSRRGLSRHLNPAGAPAPLGNQS